MSETDSTFRRLFPTLVFAALFVLSASLMAFIAWPFRTPLLLAAILASVCSSLFSWLRLRLHGRTRVTAALLTALLVAVLIGPVLWIGAFAVEQSLLGLAFLRDTMGVRTLGDLNKATLPPRLAALIDKLTTMTHLGSGQLKTLVAQAESQLRDLVPQVLGASSRVLFDAFIMVFAFYFFLVEGERLLGWLWHVSPLENRQTEELASEFQRVLKATFAGLLVAAFVQGVLMTTAYAIADVPFPFFFGLATVLGLFVPIVGTALVWAPMGAVLVMTGHLGAGMALMIFCLVVMLVTENVLKPLVMSGQIEMHIGLIFISVLGGLSAFGLIGLVTGPLVATFFLAMLRLYQRDYLR